MIWLRKTSLWLFDSLFDILRLYLCRSFVNMLFSIGTIYLFALSTCLFYSSLC